MEILKYIILGICIIVTSLLFGVLFAIRYDIKSNKRLLFKLILFIIIELFINISLYFYIGFIISSKTIFIYIYHYISILFTLIFDGFFIFLYSLSGKKFKRFLKKVIVITLIFNLTIYISSTFYISSNKVKTINNKKIVKKEKKKVVKVIDNSNKTSKGFNIEVKDGVTYIDGNIIVNKTYSLPSNYYPSNTHDAINENTSGCQSCINNDAYDAFSKMQSDASKEGLKIWIQSGYRSYKSQEILYNRYVSSDGNIKADTYSSRPGHSEHQSGYAFDLNSVSDDFASTNEGKWINNNCYKYGFIIRYPIGKEGETGYKYESWHLRYVGVDLAKILYNDGLWRSLEEYYGITSIYN